MSQPTFGKLTQTVDSEVWLMSIWFSIRWVGYGDTGAVVQRVWNATIVLKLAFPADPPPQQRTRNCDAQAQMIGIHTRCPIALGKQGSDVQILSTRSVIPRVNHTGGVRSPGHCFLFRCLYCDIRQDSRHDLIGILILPDNANHRDEIPHFQISRVVD